MFKTPTKQSYMGSGDDTRKKTQPPHFARKMLQMFCPAHLLSELDGDLMEEYYFQLKHYGHKKASYDYIMNVLSFIHPFASKGKRTQFPRTLITGSMWKNYLTTALRNFSRNMTYSVLNLAGLTIGLVCSMLIFQFVIFENCADEFHAKTDRLYRVAVTSVTAGGTPETGAQFFLGAAEAFKTEIPEVEDAIRIRADFFQEGPTISHTEAGELTAFKDIRSIIVDSTFLKMFSFPLVRGDRASALSLPNSILVSESLARRFFHDEDPIGKTLDYSMNQGPHTMLVTGVLKDVPANSHIQFDVVLPLHHHMGNIPKENLQYYSAWDYKEFTTYVSLRSGADVNRVQDLMTQVIDRNIGEDLRKLNTTVTINLQPMESLYFDRETDLGLTGFGSAIVATRTGNERMVYFFTVIAIITLAIALMSYINLSTVRSLDRAKEVGIRKVVGAQKFHLRVQFFMEAVLMNTAALILAIGIVILLMPTFNAVFETNFTWTSWFNQSFLSVLAGVFLSGVFLSGLYPAFVLSSFMPIAALKTRIGSFTSRSSLRKFFVVLQYGPAIALIICTIVVYGQLNFMQSMDVGLEMDKLITIRSARFLPEGMRSRDAEAVFKNEIKGLSTVAAASYAGNQAGRGLNFLVPFQIDSVGEAGQIEFKGTGVDHDFSKVMGLKVIAGQDFTEGMEPMHDNPDDFIRKVLVNETAVRMWGFQRNEDAVGRVVASPSGPRFYILGVLEDFNWSSVHRATEPVMLWNTPNNRFMTIRFASGADVGEAIAEVKRIYNRLFPMDVFHYEFADEVYNKQYHEDAKFAKLFGIFSGMAIAIASLGLFGLSAFSAERRSKEVGIRKVLGANVRQIIALLSREFVVLVLIAFIVASPVAWLVMDSWLESFAFRMGLNATPFIITAIGSMLIAMITVSLKSMAVANLNPVNTLRSE